MPDRRPPVERGRAEGRSRRREEALEVRIVRPEPAAEAEPVDGESVVEAAAEQQDSIAEELREAIRRKLEPQR